MVRNLLYLLANIVVSHAVVVLTTVCVFLLRRPCSRYVGGRFLRRSLRRVFPAFRGHSGDIGDILGKNIGNFYGILTLRKLEGFVRESFICYDCHAFVAAQMTLNKDKTPIGS